MSPSSLGLEPWKFVVIQDQALRDELKAHSWGAAKQLDTASHFVLIFARKNVTSRSPYVQHMLKILKNMRHKRFQLLNKNSMHSKQISIFLIMIKPCMTGQEQTYIALGNMMTTAALLGIDSCPMEGFSLHTVTDILANKRI
ncbi:nitroreductase family protein [Staphylococcus aureus]